MATNPKKINWDAVNPDVEHHGRAITLPGDPGKMPLRTAIAALERKAADEEQRVAIMESFDAHPHDAAVAVVKAMAELYGWASPRASMGFFGHKPPQMLTVKTGHNDDDLVQVPMGDFELPGLSSRISTGFDFNGATWIYYIAGTVMQRDRHVIVELANKAREILRKSSIYRGKAVSLTVDEDGSLDVKTPPAFFDCSDTTEASVLFDDDVQSQIGTSILTPIRYTEDCKKHKIPLKRGILLAGPYGTGKSLTARMVANIAEQNGWTFILLDRVQGLRTALQFAKRYSPAVVFAEDIDRVAAERDETMNDLINTIDGVISKKSELMIVLTTNHVEKLDRVILRPGRLDAVIELRAPQANTVEKLLRLYAGKLINPDTDLTAASIELAGQIPASIRECVERAKLGMVSRRDNNLVSSDLVTAARTMKNHLALLNNTGEKPVSQADAFAQALTSLVQKPTEERLVEIEKVLREVRNYVN